MSLTKQTQKRCSQLTTLGLTFNGEYFHKDDFNVYCAEITCEPEKKWEKIIKSIEKEMKKRLAAESSTREKRICPVCEREIGADNWPKIQKACRRIINQVDKHGMESLNERDQIIFMDKVHIECVEGLY